MMHRSLRALRALLLALPLLLGATLAHAAPANFDDAKEEARRYVYHDRNQGAGGDIYCGCDWQWTGRSGGRMNLDACGYRTRLQRNRAERIEWEHVVPASNFGRARQCWQNGGRDNCTRNDPVFAAMEADLHNLAPSLGEVNGDRQNYPFSPVGRSTFSYGSCDFKVDNNARIAEPRDEVKGMLARIYFYMHDHYDLALSRQQQQLLMQWDKQFPVSDWERERDRRIAQRMGHSNPFVTGAATWSLGHQNSRRGLVSPISGADNRPTGARSTPTPRPAPAPSASAVVGEIRGNRNSQVYHLPETCPGYEQVSERNRVIFASEAEAQAAGYRKAGNCS